MKTVENACPIKGCTLSVEPWRLMCGGHWRLVPLPLQRTIVKLYNNGKVTSGYKEAAASAIEQVESRLRRQRRAQS